MTVMARNGIQLSLVPIHDVEGRLVRSSKAAASANVLFSAPWRCQNSSNKFGQILFNFASGSSEVLLDATG